MTQKNSSLQGKNDKDTYKVERRQFYSQFSRLVQHRGLNFWSNLSYSSLLLCRKRRSFKGWLIQKLGGKIIECHNSTLWEDLPCEMAHPEMTLQHQSCWVAVVWWHHPRKQCLLKVLHLFYVTFCVLFVQMNVFFFCIFLSNLPQWYHVARSSIGYLCYFKCAVFQFHWVASCS